MAQEVMEVEQTSKESETPEEKDADVDFDGSEIIDHLISCKDVFFKSQQRDEDELSPREKKEIATKIFSQSKSNFLSRFGKHLKEEHLTYFKKFTQDETEGYEIGYYLADLKRYFTKTKRETDVKNRRYDALKKLIDENNYFSETEMMRRNPLLYDQLVGQYMSEDEKKKRDNIDTKNITFVNLLLESIDRDRTRTKQKQQQDDEDVVMEEKDTSGSEAEEEKEETNDTDDDSWDDEVPITSRWGEFEAPNEAPQISSFRQIRPDFFQEAESSKPKEIVMITAIERRLLKEEFMSIMYQNFLDGKDADFDYSSVDNNDAYDNLDIKTRDAEESYFDSETPEDMPPEDAKMGSENETSEDELDTFMKRLNQHHAIRHLSNEMSNL